MTCHFFVPQGTQDLGVVQQHTTHASVLIICVVSAAHVVPQVGLLCGSATPETGLCVVPQHRILVGAHAGCSVVPCPFLHRGFVILKRGMVLNKTRYTYEQNGVVYKSLAEMRVYPGGVVDKMGWSVELPI